MGRWSRSLGFWGAEQHPQQRRVLLVRAIGDISREILAGMRHAASPATGASVAHHLSSVLGLKHIFPLPHSNIKSPKHSGACLWGGLSCQKTFGEPQNTPRHLSPTYGNKGSRTTPLTPLHGAAPGPQHPAAPPATQRHQPPGTARAQPSPGAPKLPHASPGPASPACFPRSPVGFRILFAQLCSRPGPLRGRLENGVALKRVSQPSCSHRDASSHAAVAPGGYGAGCSPAPLGVGFTPVPWPGVWGDARQPSDEPNPKPHTVSWAKYPSLGQSPGFWGCHGTADPCGGQDSHRGCWPG